MVNKIYFEHTQGLLNHILW